MTYKDTTIEEQKEYEAGCLYAIAAVIATVIVVVVFVIIGIVVGIKAMGA